MSIAETSNNGEEVVHHEEKILGLIRELPILGELFDVHFKIGEGTFSNVYLGILKSSTESTKYAIKHLIPTYPPARVERELRCLRDIGGADNVVGIEFCVRNGSSVAFVMPYMRHTKFSDYISNMDNVELKFYMRALLIALRKVHLFNIIHRDVKPSNFLYDRRSRRYLLVDFGLAQEYKQEKKVDAVTQVTPETYCVKRKRANENKRQISQDSISKCETENKCYCFGKPRVCSLCLMRPAQVASRAGTPGYRAPEVLFKYPHQTPAIDIWASGVIMLCILSATQPFFRCPDDCTALAEITTLFGTQKMQTCARKLGKKLICSENLSGLNIPALCEKLRARLKSSFKDHSRSDHCKKIRNENYPPEAYDLLLKLLDVDFKSRITADEALNHPFLRV